MACSVAVGHCPPLVQCSVGEGLTGQGQGRQNCAADNAPVAVPVAVLWRWAVGSGPHCALPLLAQSATPRCSAAVPEACPQFRYLLNLRSPAIRAPCRHQCGTSGGTQTFLGSGTYLPADANQPITGPWRIGKRLLLLNTLNNIFGGVLPPFDWEGRNGVSLQGDGSIHNHSRLMKNSESKCYHLSSRTKCVALDLIQLTSFVSKKRSDTGAPTFPAFT